MKSILPEVGVWLNEVEAPGTENDQFSFSRVGAEVSEDAGDGVDDSDRITIENDLRHQPQGIQTYGGHIGVCANGTPDFTVVKLDNMGVGKAVYTRSLSCGDAIRFDRENTLHGDIQLLCVVSKNANVFTPTSRKDIDTIAAQLEKELGVPATSQLISCTGVIGVQLPMDIIAKAIDGVGAKLRPATLEQAAEAILTTDKQAKMASVTFDGITLCGFAKGAGMIEPNMATMLSYFFTDAKINKTDLDAILKRAVDKSFNSISVDSDTSTSDTVAIFSTNEKELDEVGLQNFERALTAICLKLARDIVGQAEGANQVIEAKVSLPTSYEDARLFTKKIINSPLIKTAVYGRDPNWGRIVMAVGKPSERETISEIQPKDLLIKILGQTVFEYGHQIPLDLEALTKRMGEEKTVDIEVEIGEPIYTAKAWGCDLSEGYIKINAEYTT